MARVEESVSHETSCSTSAEQAHEHARALVWLYEQTCTSKKRTDLKFERRVLRGNYRSGLVVKHSQLLALLQRHLLEREFAPSSGVTHIWVSIT